MIRAAAAALLLAPAAPAAALTLDLPPGATRSHEDGEPLGSIASPPAPGPRAAFPPARPRAP
jgi:hypothetical protein